MAAHTYADRARHIGDEVVCVDYANGDNVALECEECREVLLDFDRPDLRHIVEVTTEGFQVLDSWTDALRADVWSSRGQAQDACDELDRSTANPARRD
ncbi:MAG: hypothetical protein JSS68_09345 [Actinobacteria bacterium]|nr:hypothetical protein [Actinomycetota bacterium]MBS1882928.1 hypothetical protein [Actinomycetota bacterium]